MEAFQPGTKRRVLPTWMAAQGAEKNALTLKTPKKRRTVAAVAQTSRVLAMNTVYCMSEAELVDVALGILVEDRKQEQSYEQLALAGADKPELSPTCSASPSWSPSWSSPGSQSEDEDHGKDALSSGLCPSPGPGGSDSACSRSPEKDEDVLKYVREIFFS
ncbi:cell cycle regulator of non-homologous end joining [Erinaceus europaeus]|uniref:Cell cycle regulator of non-homologous end joining n=1 Tax=Erinaceus europaeus TaxID=9365 RepID=A0A1S3WFY3_ERIEU|nr:cell cycle regulator of non-homologous end joining [Erinaceus europaeus]XP_060052614.1 cell cycle regulator of non-homologous end joining [Erinaceus europaeus]